MSDQRALIEALRRPPSSRPAAIAALADVSRLRAALDDFERSAIDAARAGGASWAEIAAALGLASRQAAEQRRARLGPGQAAQALQALQARQAAQATPPIRDTTPPIRKRQHSIDNLRRALKNLAAIIDNAPARTRPGTVTLARDTLEIALDAPPGQQIDLARLITEDLRTHAENHPKIAAAIQRISVFTDRTD